MKAFLFYGWLAIVPALFGNQPSHAPPSISEQLTVGSIRAAQWKLAFQADDRAGLDLLLFGLAVNPENREALLLQAKVERGLPIEIPQADDADNKAFIDLLANLAPRTTATDRRLLLYKILEIVDPANEAALLELTRAKNQGVDISFNALIKCLNPPATRPTPGSPPPSGQPPRTPETAGGQPLGQERIREAVARLRINNMTVGSGIMRTISHIDSAALRPIGASLDYRSTRFPATIYSSSSTSIYYASSSGLGYGHEFQRAILPYAANAAQREIGAFEWLAELAAIYNLELHFTDRFLQIIDAREETGVTNGLEAVSATTLVRETEQGIVDFLRKYRGKRILLKGSFSALGRAMRDHYVELEAGKVRLLLDPGIEEWRLNQLKEHTGQGRTIYAIGECDGISGGRIILKKCRFVGW